MPLVDALKAISCLLIVSHHLSIYGPMSDLAYPLIPGLIEWLREYARMAVQVFFVVAGFLMAGKLVPLGVPLVADPVQSIKRRYIRLVIPYLVHFPLCLVVNAAFFHFLPHQAVTNLFGLVLAFGISILGGALFYKWVESRPLTNKMKIWLPAGFVTSGLIVALGSS